MKKIKISILVMLILFTACKKEQSIEKSQSGYFILSQLNGIGLKSASNLTNDSIKTSFLLGDVKASKEFYFIISNGGENSISNVEISSDNSAFQIMPEKIDTLPGKNSASNNLIPLLSLSVIHGIQLNGVGYTALLPMNNNEAKITITGNTIENGKSIQIKSIFNFSVNAKEMNVQVFNSNNEEVDLTNPKSSVMLTGKNYGGLSTFRYYQLSGDNLKIKNTGNVDISVQSYFLNDNGTSDKEENFNLAPGLDKVFKISNDMTMFELDGKGTITDASRLELGNDGKAYFVIIK